MRDAYAEQALGLIDGGAHMLLLETIFDTLNAKAALVGIEDAFDDARRPPAADDFGHDHRSQRPHAVGPDARRVLRLDGARAAVQRRPELRARRARDSAVPRRARAHRHLLRQLLSQRRPAQRVRPVRRAARRDRAPAARVRRQRLRQHHRRLLRHDARITSARSRGPSTGAAPRVASGGRRHAVPRPVTLLGSRDAGRCGPTATSR